MCRSLLSSPLGTMGALAAAVLTLNTLIHALPKMLLTMHSHAPDAGRVATHSECQIGYTDWLADVLADNDWCFDCQITL